MGENYLTYAHFLSDISIFCKCSLSTLLKSPQKIENEIPSESYVNLSSEIAEKCENVFFYKTPFLRPMQG